MGHVFCFLLELLLFVWLLAFGFFDFWLQWLLASVASWLLASVASWLLASVASWLLAAMASWFLASLASLASWLVLAAFGFYGFYGFLSCGFLALVDSLGFWLLTSFVLWVLAFSSLTFVGSWL